MSFLKSPSVQMIHNPRSPNTFDNKIFNISDDQNTCEAPVILIIEAPLYPVPSICPCPSGLSSADVSGSNKFMNSVFKSPIPVQKKVVKYKKAPYTVIGCTIPSFKSFTCNESS